MRRVAIVLPPREAFSPAASGAIGLLARRHARWEDGWDATVFGTAPPTPPFRDVAFVPIRPGWRGYVHAVAGSIRSLRPALVEVHNRPDLALALARRGWPVTLLLNNDPRGMRGTATPGERRALLARLAGVATSSTYLADRLLDGIPDPPAPPTVLPNCLDREELPAPAALRENAVLFAGRVVADKG
ncbi:MAG: glycosyltransferase family 1 protein, partial [Acetobacteraceae bacterium]|nr:glycosyltransferase family 1 protein [Acetobacteraceae bacterium]